MEVGRKDLHDRGRKVKYCRALAQSGNIASESAKGAIMALYDLLQKAEPFG